MILQFRSKFNVENPQSIETMKTHLIENLDDFGVWSDNYQDFMDKRADVLSKEIRKRIIPQKIDKQPHSNSEEDYSKN